MLKEQIKAAAIQAKARNSSGGQRPKAPSNMEGNTKKAKEAKEASKKVRQAPIAKDTSLTGLMSSEEKHILLGLAQVFAHSGSRHFTF